MKSKHSQESRVLFLGKKDNPFAERAAEHLRKHLRDPLIFIGDRHDKLPEEVAKKATEKILFSVGKNLPIYRYIRTQLEAGKINPPEERSLLRIR